MKKTNDLRFCAFIGFIGFLGACGSRYPQLAYLSLLSFGSFLVFIPTLDVSKAKSNDQGTPYALGPSQRCRGT